MWNDVRKRVDLVGEYEIFNVDYWRMKYLA